MIAGVKFGPPDGPADSGAGTAALVSPGPLVLDPASDGDRASDFKLSNPSGRQWPGGAALGLRLGFPL